MFKIIIIYNGKEDFDTVNKLESLDSNFYSIVSSSLAEGYKTIITELSDLVIINVSESLKEEISLIRQIRESDIVNRMPIIALCKNEKDSKFLVLEAGANHCLSNTADKNELNILISKLVKSSSEEKELKTNRSLLEKLVSERTHELEEELTKRVNAEAELKSLLQYIESSKRAALNLMDDLQEEIVEREVAQGELEQSRLQLRELNTYVQHVREKEKAEISREIHDVIGQALTALKFDLMWINKSVQNGGEEVFQKIEEMKKLIDETTVSVQRISTELRPGLLDDLGLTYALEWQSEQFEQRTGIKCELNFSPEDINLEEKYSVELFRIVQESLTNVARHAQATKVLISLKMANSEVELLVADNGVGIDEENKKDPKSLGLLGISERVHNIGGKVTFSGEKNIGTEVKVIVQLENGGE